MRVQCAHCNGWTEKTPSRVNRAIKDGMKIYCDRRCMSLSFQVHRTGTELAEFLERKRQQRRRAEKRYRAAHPERVKEGYRRYRAKNRERIREYQRSRPEQKRESFRKYYWKNRDALLARTKLYRASNRERLLAKGREYRERNAERLRLYALKNREFANARRRAFRLANLQQERARALASYHRNKVKNAEKIRQASRKRYSRHRDQILARSKLESKKRTQELHDSYLRVIARQYGFPSPTPQALGALKALVRVRRLVKERINGNQNSR